MTDAAFKDSQESAMRRIIREAIRKGEFTKSERDVTMAVFNHWFHHKGSKKGFIHPSRAAIAKKSGVSVRTVASTLAMLRAATVLNPVSGTRGGYAKATQYSVDCHALMVLCGCDWIDEFMRGRAGSCTVFDAYFARYFNAEIAHCLNDVGLGPSQAGKSDE